MLAYNLKRVMTLLGNQCIDRGDAGLRPLLSSLRQITAFSYRSREQSPEKNGGAMPLALARMSRQQLQKSQKSNLTTVSPRFDTFWAA